MPKNTFFIITNTLECLPLPDGYYPPCERHQIPNQPGQKEKNQPVFYRRWKYHSIAQFRFYDHHRCQVFRRSPLPQEEYE
ncbi:unnamed protein product [Caenorhabditis nigoni]